MNVNILRTIEHLLFRSVRYLSVLNGTVSITVLERNDYCAHAHFMCTSHVRTVLQRVNTF